MNTIKHKIQSQSLLKIKKIIEEDKNGDKFIIIRTKKNRDFMMENGLNDEDVKNIIKELSVQDCFSGPEPDRDSKYKGYIFKFYPIFNEIKLYIKIRIESSEKSICLSIHEFGKYDSKGEQK